MIVIIALCYLFILQAWHIVNFVVVVEALRLGAKRYRCERDKNCQGISQIPVAGPSSSGNHAVMFAWHYNISASAGFLNLNNPRNPPPERPTL